MKKINLLLFILFYGLIKMNAQVTKDAGMWNTFSIEKEISDKFSIAIDEEIRLKENFSMLNLFYTNIGVSYKLPKSIKLSLTYRLIEKWKYEQQYFSYRNRLMLDLGYKYKSNRWTLSYRSRIQTEYRDIYSSELGKISEWYWRNKIDLKYKIDKISPYIGAEFRYQLSDPRAQESNRGWHRARTYIGLDYEIDKTNTLGLYYLIQQEFDVLKPEYLYIVGIQYSIKILPKGSK